MKLQSILETSDTVNNSEYLVLDLNNIKPQKLRSGNDITVVGISYTSLLCEKACATVENKHKISSDFFDIRVLNPLKIVPLAERLNLPLKFVVFLNTPLLSGDKPEFTPAPEVAPRLGRKFPFEIATSLSARDTLRMFCLIEMLFSMA